MYVMKSLLFLLGNMLTLAKAEEAHESALPTPSSDLSKSVFSTVDSNGNPIWVNLSPENTKVMSQDIHTSPVYGDALAHKLVPIQVISVLGTPTMSGKNSDAQFLYEIPYAVQNAALMILAMAVKNGTPTAHNFLGDAFTSRFRYPPKAQECTSNGSNRKANTGECGEGYEKVSYIRPVAHTAGSGKEKSLAGANGSTQDSSDGDTDSSSEKNKKKTNDIKKENEKESDSMSTSNEDGDNGKNSSSLFGKNMLNSQLINDSPISSLN